MLVWITNFLYGVIKLSAPIVYAALACDVTRKAGLYNMSIEGNMLIFPFIFIEDMDRVEAFPFCIVFLGRYCIEIWGKAQCCQI